MTAWTPSMPVLLWMLPKTFTVAAWAVLQSANNSIIFTSDGVGETCPQWQSICPLAPTACLPSAQIRHIMPSGTGAAMYQLPQLPHLKGRLLIKLLFPQLEACLLINRHVLVRDIHGDCFGSPCHLGIEHVPPS